MIYHTPFIQREGIERSNPLDTFPSPVGGLGEGDNWK